MGSGPSYPPISLALTSLDDLGATLAFPIFGAVDELLAGDFGLREMNFLDLCGVLMRNDIVSLS